jgi:hypothetical protein
MKRSFYPLLLPTLLLGLFAPVSIRASETAPMFGADPLTVNGTTYTWVSATEDETSHTDIYDASGSALTVSGLIANADLATVSGTDISGYLLNGTYGNLVQTNSTGISLSLNGKEYTTIDTISTYAVDLENEVLSSTDKFVYLGADGSLNVATDGQITGSETGYYLNGVWYLNGSGSETISDPSPPSLTLFGNVYYLSETWWSDSYDSNGGLHHSTGENYVTENAGYMHVSHSNGGTSTNGWDPYVGNFSSSDSSSLTWDPRTAASFASANLWVNGALVVWSGGSIENNGTITDSYSGTALLGGSVTLTISGNARAYSVDGVSATVRLNAAAAGSYTQAGVFTQSSIQNGDPNQTTALFCGASLWVNGTEFLFIGGWEDSANHRSDTYVNASSGFLTISGNSSDAGVGDVLVNYNGIESGDFSAGNFTVGALDIQSQNPAGLPTSFWVRGRFYQRAGSSYASGAAVIAFTWTDSDSISLTGSGDAGSLTGSFDIGSAGIFTLSEGSIPVPACPANANGTLILAASSAPTNFPPAVMITGHGIWTYLGSAADEGDPAFTAAYYGNAVTAHDAGSNHCLLRIRLDGSVTLCDYTAQTTMLGRYKPVPHLFVTEITDSLPMPIYGVDPNHGHALWDLLQPPAGLPDTFLVHGEVWRYSGTDASGKAMYDGYFTNQKLILAAPNTSGLRLVTVTDPIHGDTLGTLNDVRGSVRMRDGSVVYSGSSQGTRINPTLNESNLHTIAADLDITGNVLTFGALTNDAAAAGLTVQFRDLNNVASLGFALGRSAADWTWYHAAANPTAPSVPMMKLDSGNKLTLHNPANPAQAGITLNPASGGVSSIQGTLRVRPGGDISMGTFTTSPSGMTAP